MLSFLKSDPVKRLQKKYEQLLEEAFHAQRNGKILLYSQLTAEAEELRTEIDDLKKS